MAPSHALAFCEGAAKRWQGYVRAGLLSREIGVWGADTLLRVEGHATVAIARAAGGACAVEEPGHVRNLHAREPGGPVVDHGLLMMLRPGWFAGWHIGGLGFAG